MSKLVLIDGHSIINRAFYGVPELTNSAGLHTNAIYGFLNILFKILDEEKPDYLTVAFDVKAPTFRHEMFEAYKGTRKPMADELREQIPVVKDVLKAMGIRLVEKPGFEADDVLGTLAYLGQSKGLEVTLVSGDRDLLQVATDRIKIRIPKTRGGKTTIEDYYAADVEAAYGVNPKVFIDMKALMGDTSDNIPGVPKVGEKTAKDLLVEWGSLDGVYENLEKINRKALKETLEQNKELAYLSQRLATIKLDVPLEYKLEDSRLGSLYTDEAYRLFKQLEFKNLLGRFETVINYDEISASFRMVDDYTEACRIVDAIACDSGTIGIRLVYDDQYTDNLLGLVVSTSVETVFIKCWMLLNEDNISVLVKKINDTGVRIATADIKKLFRLYDGAADHIDDIILMAYLNNPIKNDYSINDIANEYLGMLLPLKAQLFKKQSLAQALETDELKFTEYVCYEGYACAHSIKPLKDRLSELGEEKLYTDIELPLSRVLYEMEQEGIAVRPEELREYSGMLAEHIGELEQAIFKEAGCEFNINSPKQLGEILFETLKLPGGKKTKTGYSTAADVLEKLSEDYPIAKSILEYRAYTKLKSTYADGLQEYIDEHNRIHSTFNQTITATGRLSSTEPNLQNIPVRMELGKQIRRVFVPKDGFVFMDADYSQIELRVLASMAGDETLIKAYSEHADIHRITASQVFHVPFAEVTDLQRRNAKAVNFGIVYGISAFGLGEDLGISAKEAKQYIEDYFKTYPKIKSFLDDMVSNAKTKGYSTTYYGRRRPIPELNSSNFIQRSFGERVAMNSPIQGTAADIIKIAMLRVHNALKSRGLESKLILQVHDELLIETKIDEIKEVEAILTEEMTNAASLAVKLEIDLHVGNNWLEAK